MKLRKRGKIKITVELDTNYVREMLRLYRDIFTPILKSAGLTEVTEALKQIKL